MHHVLASIVTVAFAGAGEFEAILALLKDRETVMFTFGFLGSGFCFGLWLGHRLRVGLGFGLGGGTSLAL